MIPTSTPFPYTTLFRSALLGGEAGRSFARHLIHQQIHLGLHDGGHDECTISRQADQGRARSEEHTSELQSPCNLVCRLLLEKKKERELETESMSLIQRR